MLACRQIWPTIRATSTGANRASLPARSSAIDPRPRPSSPAPGSSACTRASGSASTSAQLARHHARAASRPRRSCCWLRRASSCAVASTSPNLPNSVFTAPSICHTSLERFSIASVRKPICRLVSSASKRGRPGHVDAVLALQRLDQAGPAQHLGVQAFGRQEQDREIGGVRRRDVLVADARAPPARTRVSSASAGGVGRRRGRRAPARRAGARSPRAGTWRRSAATPARRPRAGPAAAPRTRRARCCPARSRRWSRTAPA